MTALPTIGLALIVKDEEESLPTLLLSIAGAFDQVVLVDTGSTDRTVEVFQEWACKQTGMIYKVARFTWVDDFAAARAHADSLLTTTWTCWADADDRLEGAGNLRQIAAQAPDEVAAFVFDYAYAHDQHGNLICNLRRERLVRRGHGEWAGRVHEAQLVNGASQLVDPGVARWVHAKRAHEPSDRNLRILNSWHEADPENSRVLMYLGVEEAARGNHEVAVRYYERYLSLLTGWDEERAQVHRKYACSLLALGRAQDAVETALAALMVIPHWPDSYLTLAEACYHLGEYEKAAAWARDVLRLGMPDSLLILNPLDYTFSPRIILAGALGTLGDIEQAITVGDEALALVPGHPDLQAAHLQWRRKRKTDQTAATFCGSARLLVSHDEPLKALALLDAVPHYAADHPDVVELRSLIRERVRPLLTDAAAHYESDTEDGMTDEFAASLPRAEFLRRGLTEQLGEAA